MTSEMRAWPRVAAALVFATLATAARSAPERPDQRLPRRPPVITSFALDDGATVSVGDLPVVLTHTAVGAPPTEYRVSARGDFAGTTWRAYLRRPTLPGWEALTTRGCEVEGTNAKLKLFLQVRATLGDSVRIVNGQRTLVPITAESNVVADSLCMNTGR